MNTTEHNSTTNIFQIIEIMNQKFMTITEIMSADLSKLTTRIITVGREIKILIVVLILQTIETEHYWIQVKNWAVWGA
jgi:uncharacterized protein YaaR (DUF327 family)